MRFWTGSLPLLIPVVLAACGGQKPAEAPASESAAPAAAAESSEPAAAEANKEAAGDGGASVEGVPTKCFKSGSICSPDPKFVKRLCNGKFPSIGLYLFSNPAWTRGYLTRRTQAWNASGGASDSGWVEFDEEVLILYARLADTGGMQVSGATGSVDVLRWDGTCATLSTEEVRFQAPSKPKHALIPWRILEDATQEALKQNEALAKVATERKKECKGATMGAVSAKCEKADKALNDLVVDAVRTGTTVPKPAKVP